jgi:hypothetical protein
MNKRRNKSVTKTKHLVQKTKRNRRLNKNRSVKGIRGNNKTKVVGKRRNIVQRGGGEINNLVGRIFALDTLEEDEIPNSVIDTIMDDVTVQNTQERTPIKKPDGSIVNDGISLLYAACRLKNHPSHYLVRKILEKMQDQHSGISFGALLKRVNGNVRGSEWNRIIPNGLSVPSAGSYPQHGAVQAAREILENRTILNDETTYTKLKKIIEILNLLKEYDSKVPKASGIMRPPIMELPNKLGPDNGGFTAYQEFNLIFVQGTQSVEGLINSILPSYARDLVAKFEVVLDKPKKTIVHSEPPHTKTMGGPPLANG